jgi:hypothetical protein
MVVLMNATPSPVPSGLIFAVPRAGVYRPAQQSLVTRPMFPPAVQTLPSIRNAPVGAGPSTFELMVGRTVRRSD